MKIVAFLLVCGLINRTIAILVSHLMILHGPGFLSLDWKIQISIVCYKWPIQNGKFSKLFFVVFSKVFSRIQLQMKLEEIRQVFFTYIEIISLFLVSSDKWLYRFGKNKILIRQFTVKCMLCIFDIQVKNWYCSCNGFLHCEEQYQHLYGKRNPFHLKLLPFSLRFAKEVLITWLCLQSKRSLYPPSHFSSGGVYD